MNDLKQSKFKFELVLKMRCESNAITNKLINVLL